jgi:prepilin-type N-terminal cleavage/methylation domain-containing protein
VFDRLRTRLASESGFTLIELLVVFQILAIVVLIAVPAYLGTATKARIVDAQSNVNSAITPASSYYADTANNPTPYTFGSISGAKLRIEQPGVGPNVMAGTKTVLTMHDAYCIQDSEDGGATFYHYEGGVGGAAVIVLGACAAAYSVA